MWGVPFLKTFPEPLTASEERYYLQKYTEGDLEAKHILIERNLRLVAHIVKKYQHLDEILKFIIYRHDRADKAVPPLTWKRGNRLATYAARCIEKATPPLWLHL